MAGPYIRISGAIYLDCVISATLVGYNSLMPPLQFTQLDEGYASHHDRYAMHTAHTLHALQKCLDELKREYSSMKEGDLHIFETPTGTLPAPHFRSFTSLENIKYKLKYCSHLLNKPRGSRSIFLAEATSDTTDPIMCVVKFTDRYGKDAHAAMEEIHMAAELLYCSWEDSVGLIVVITKYYKCNLEAPLSDEVLQQLENGLKTLRDQNLVHGDIRRPNILTDEKGCIKLIDFEWSGKAGVVRYPALLNPEIPWPEGVKPGGLIQPEHDRLGLALYKKQRDAANRAQT
jgi:hypothetical protein